MSATPTDISLVAEPGSGRNESLPRNARFYFIAVAIIAAGVTLPFIGRLQTTDQWPAFLILASAAATARLFVVRTPADQAYHTDIVFLIPAALILPPELLVLVAVVQMVPGERRLYPVGRLDADSTGLILLTNDGELTNKLVLTKDAPIADVAYGIDNTFASRPLGEGAFASFSPSVSTHCDKA